MHLGGHDEDQDETGAPLLIDSHGKAVVDPVWALLDYTLAKSGPKPLLIEWDNDVPEWDVLSDELIRADGALVLYDGIINRISQRYFRSNVACP